MSQKNAQKLQVSLAHYYNIIVFKLTVLLLRKAILTATRIYIKCDQIYRQTTSLIKDNVSL